MAQEREENKSIWESKWVRGGAVVFVLGAVLGIGLVAELGAIAVAGGTGAHLLSKRGKR